MGYVLHKYIYIYFCLAGYTSTKQRKVHKVFIGNVVESPKLVFCNNSKLDNHLDASIAMYYDV